MSKYSDEAWDSHYDAIYGKLGGVFDCDVKFTTNDDKKHELQIDKASSGFDEAIEEIKKEIKKKYNVKGKVLVRRSGGDYYVDNDWR
jgi:hypothetical protein